jgi:hypothetical protein
MPLTQIKTSGVAADAETADFPDITKIPEPTWV